MADYLLHENALVLCAHQSGRAQPAVTNPRVTVSRQEIVTQSSTYSIAGCSNPPQSGGPCAAAQWMSAATRVKAGGAPVLLKTSQAQCVPTGTGLNANMTQTRVTGT
jgi:hypothetical protein